MPSPTPIWLNTTYKLLQLNHSQMQNTIELEIHTNSRSPDYQYAADYFIKSKMQKPNLTLELRP